MFLRHARGSQEKRPGSHRLSYLVAASPNDGRRLASARARSMRSWLRVGITRQVTPQGRSQC